jgi:hypothetical protein
MKQLQWCQLLIRRIVASMKRLVSFNKIPAFDRTHEGRIQPGCDQRISRIKASAVSLVKQKAHAALVCTMGCHDSADSISVRMYVSCRHGNYDSLQLSHLFPGFLLPTPTAEMCGRQRAMGPAWSPLVVPQRETGLQTALK